MNATRATLLTLGLGALVAIAVAAYSVLPYEGWMMAVERRLSAVGGPLGALLFGTFYVLCAMLLVPSSGLSLVAGLLYGFAGIPIAWLCILVTAALSLLLVRHLLGERVTEALRDRTRLRILREVADEEGWRMVLLVRISGVVPFGLQNYALGLTGIGIVPYLLATSVGALPSILVYAGLGALGQVTVDGERMGSARVVLLAIAIVASLALVAITARKVRARFRAALP